MHTTTLEYTDQDKILEAYIAYPDNIDKAPVVLVAHDWSGRNSFSEQKTEALAGMGYIGFALDMYGKGVLGETVEEKSQLIQPFVEDRGLLLRRMQVAYDTAVRLEGADADKTAAIGFCFGGMCVLDLARSGTDITGVVSFHGLLNPTGMDSKQNIPAKILALHGHEDPMVTPEQVLEFQTEMTAAKADWQFHSYGRTLHAFTNPEANDQNLGTIYNSVANDRAWLTMRNFLTEIF